MGLISINGVHLEASHITTGAAGPTARAPMVFLHEGLGSVAMWRDWPAQLCQATGREGWVYSRRGYGQSDAVPEVRGAGRLKPDYMHDEAWTVLPALLKALDVETPVLVGHSDGGSIALLHASRFAVSACVVMAPHVMVEDLSVQSIRAARDAFTERDLRQRLARYHDDPDSAFYGWNRIWLHPPFKQWSIEAEIAAIRCPILAVQGLDDEYGTLEQIRGIARGVPHTQLLELPACGHSPHRDQPEALIEAATSFFHLHHTGDKKP